MMTETAEQKIARLKALRFARDGSPDENKAAARALAARRQVMKDRAFDELCSAISATLRTNPDAVMNSLPAIARVAAKLAR
jgi:hypothetical protein